MYHKIIITTKQILATNPCRSKEYLDKLYPMTLRQALLQEKRNGIDRPITDRLWVACFLYNEEYNNCDALDAKATLQEVYECVRDKQ